MSRADSPLLGRVIFNVGSRRSGTYWLQRVVGAHPLVDAVPPETHLFSHGIALLFDRVQHRDRESLDVGAVWADRDVLVDATRDLCDRLLEPYATGPENRVAERTPVHAFHLPLIAEIYPDARVVHIIRDGRDVARSIAGRDWGPDTVGGAAAEWRSAVLSARGAGLPPDRYREVRYERLLAEPEAEVTALLEWLGLPADGDALAACLSAAREEANVDATSAGVGTGKWRTAYSPADLERFLGVAGDLLADLGYDAGERAAGEAEPGREARTRKYGSERRLLRARRGAVELADLVAGCLAAGRPEPMIAALSPEAIVRVLSSGGRYGVGPEDAAAVLRWFVDGEGLLRGREVEREVYPGNPWTAVVLVVEGDDGERADGAFLIRTRGRAIAELALYSFPRDSREPVAIGVPG